MKYLVSISFFFLGFLALQAQETDPNGYNKFYFPNGNISSEGTLRDGKPDDYWKTYYENGNLKSEGNRVNYELAGPWKFYNEEGVITVEINYSEGKKEGPRKFYEEGKLVKEESYKNDLKDGLTKTFYPDGSVHEEIPFVEGRESGIAYEYAEDDGRIISMITYKNGYVNKKEYINRVDKFGQKQDKWIEFYEDGTVKLEGRYKNDKKDGYWKDYTEEGSLISTTKWKNGILIPDPEELAKLDIKTKYHPNAQPKFVGSYNKDVEEGVHRFYSEDGEITASKIYHRGVLLGEGIVDAEGKRQGPWKEFFETGELKSEGKYKDGKRVGPWKHYHANGKIEQTGSYVDGQPDGEWKWYFSDGALRREETYYLGKEDGTSIEYNDTGKVVTKGDYIEGLREGPWVVDVNDHREVGSYRDGQMHGDWKFYDDEDILVFEGTFVDGQPDGKHSWYYHGSGKLKERGKYIIGSKEGDWIKYFEDGTIMQTITHKNGVEVAIDGKKLPDSEQ